MENETSGLYRGGTKMYGRLKRVSAGTYSNDSGELLRLVPVDRIYGHKKKPVYYLQRIKDKKAEYVTGLFETKQKAVFSGDIKDALGVKTYLRVEAINSGESLEITKASRPIQ